MGTLALRTITGTIETGDGLEWPAGRITFTPVDVFGGVGTTIPIREFSVYTDTAGAFTIDLYTLDDTAVSYDCVLPSGDTFRFNLDAGAATTLELLRETAYVPVNPSYYQPLDADLTAIGALTPVNDDLLQRKAGAWTNRTIAQVKSDLALNNVPNTDATARATHTGTQTSSTISDFASTTRSTVLTGLGVGVDTPIVATDTVLDAFENLQAQIDASGLTVGSAVVGGGANRVLYEDASQNLAASAALTFDGAKLSVQSAAEQLRLGYDASNYKRTVVNGNGTIDNLISGTSASERWYNDAAGKGSMTLDISSANPTLYLSGDATGGYYPTIDLRPLGSSTSGGYIQSNSTNGGLILGGRGGGLRVQTNGNYTQFVSYRSTSQTAPQAIWGHENGSTVFSAIDTNGYASFGAGNAPSAGVHVIKTTEQLRIGYDASNYFNATVGSTGGVTLDAVGSGAGFTFSDGVTINGALTLSAQNIVTDTTTGIKIGTGTTQKIGFFNATPVVQRTDFTALTDSSTGTIGSTIADATGAETVDLSTVNDNFATLTDRINDIRTVLRDLGLMA